MNIAVKWKEFALRYILSSWDEVKINPVDLFDGLVGATPDELVVLFDQYDVVVWSKYEGDPITNAIECMFDLAESAQYTADLN